MTAPRTRLAVFPLIVALLAAVASAPALAEKRVAFVVGIKDYPNLVVRDSQGNEHLIQQLKTPLDDVDTMASTLSSLGFDDRLSMF